MKSSGYDPYLRFAAALIGSAIVAARKLEHPDRSVKTSALKAIAWLALPGTGDQWFEMAGVEHSALIEHLPIELWIERGREMVAADPELRRAIT